MKKIFQKFLLAALMPVCLSISMQAKAATSLDSNSHVIWSSTHEAWTFPVTDNWTENGTIIEVGPFKGLPALKNGEHYFDKDISTGELDISKWAVGYETHNCIHNDYDEKNPWKGVSYNMHNCFQRNSSGWLATCADCGRAIGGLFYGEAEDIASVKALPIGTAYYSLCQNCNNLEQGFLITHTCQDISANKYTVEYEKNGASGGYVKESTFMYNNATMYEGESIIPDTKLRKNSFTRTGFEFTGWNTMPDGSGVSYSDGQTVLNIGGKTNDKQIITLYAQWKQSNSTLNVNPNGGTFKGSSGITSTMQAYGTTCSVPNPSPRSGYLVSFNSMGGNGVAAVRTSATFASWSRNSDFHGILVDAQYVFKGANGTTDTLTANYNINGITLPSTARSGYTFTGWYYDSSCREFAGKAGTIFYPTSDGMTLYAGWAKLTLTSNDNYSANGGKGAVNLSWVQNDGIAKSYKIYQSTNNANWTEIHGANELGNTLSASKSFGYVNYTETYTVPYTGLYTLSGYGAQGGNYSNKIGGYGGYLGGDVFLQKGEVVYVTVGGQNSYNGGGSASMGGVGGGMTSISTNLKGTIMIVGGGGGAGDSGNGGAGGAAVSNIAGNVGGSGSAGGGAGGNGGTGGEYVVHHHTAACYRDNSYNAFNQYDVSVGQNKWVDNSGQNHWGHCDVTQSNGTLIPTKGNTSLSLKGYMIVSTDGYMDGTLYLYDQNGTCFYSSNSANVPLYYDSFQEGDWDDTGDYYYSDVTFKRLDVSPNEYKYRRGADGNMLDWKWVVNGGWNSLNAPSTFDSGGVTPFAIPPFENFSALRGWGDFYNRSFRFNSGTRYWRETAIGFAETVNIPAGVTGIKIRIESHWNESRGWMFYNAGIDQMIFSGAQQVVCGYTEGQVISSKPAYGGTNWYNGTYVRNAVSYAGQKAGNGSFSIVSKNLGFMDSSSLTGVKATDYAAPNAINTGLITMAPAGNNVFTLTWVNPGDNGTAYYHKVDSYALNTGTAVYSMTSNVTKNILTTGVSSYRYTVNTSSGTNLGAGSGTGTTSPTISLQNTTYDRYLHVATVDKAGNVSGTAHYLIPGSNSTSPSVDWQVYTGQMFIRGDSGNVYQAPNGYYYVKADNETPFTAWYTGYMNGSASPNYQIDTAYFLASSDAGEEIISATTPKSSTLSGTATYKGSDLNTQYTLPDYLQDAAYATAKREASMTQITMEYKFTANQTYSGKTTKLYPRVSAYNSRTNKTNVSDTASDQSRGINLVFDGEAPVITGTDALNGLTELDRQSQKVLLKVSATDALSGMKSLEIKVENNDNHMSQTFTSAGKEINIDITENSLLFIGNISITITASDMVGNTTTYGYNIQNYSLETNLDKYKEPHGREFKAGETGTITINSTGYLDKIVVEFPDELTRLDSTLNRTFEYLYDEGTYDEHPELAETGAVKEELEFAVPLKSPDGSYQVKITAYDNGEIIDSLTRFEDFTVKGNVLDELISIIISSS